MRLRRIKARHARDPIMVAYYVVVLCLVMLTSFLSYANSAITWMRTASERQVVREHRGTSTLSKSFSFMKMNVNLLAAAYNYRYAL